LEWKVENRSTIKLKTDCLRFSFLVAGHGESYHGQGREEKRKLLHTPLSAWILAAARGNSGAEGLPCNSRLFCGYFIIFFICVTCYLSYFKFLLFVITYGCIRKNIIKRDVCVVCIFFFMYVNELKNQKDKK